MGDKIIKKGKSNSWWSIISFSFFKIRRAMAVWVLLLLSLVLFGTIAITLFSSSKNIYDFFKNFQYGVFIFNNILLLLFILLVIIKIFGREFEDGTYLLLISKPYSRFTLFFLKLISVWILIILFLGSIILFALGIGYIGSLFNKNPEYIQVYQNLLLKLFIYSIVLSFFASSGILFSVTFLNSQVVLLIVVIFCSLFLVGGMPYSLIMSLANNIDLKLDHKDVKQNYPVPIIKSTINFKRYLEKNLIKYDKLTNKIWDFYNDWDYTDLTLVFSGNDYKNISDDATLRIKRLDFYKSLGLTKEKTEDFTIESLKKWDTLTKYDYNGKPDTINNIISQVGSSNLKMKMRFSTDYFFKSPVELDSNNEIQKELLDFINFIGSSTSWRTYIATTFFNATSLYYFNLDKSYYSLEATNNDSKLKSVERKLKETDSFNPVTVLTSEWNRTNGVSMSSDYENGNEFEEWILQYFGASDDYDNDFEIKTVNVLREFELNIIKKVIDYKLLLSVPLVITSEWQKYDNLMHTYELISMFNIIEHWNQIWTSSLSYVPFRFTPLNRSNIDFSVQNNYLMSYQDFPITLFKENKKVNLDEPPFLNIDLILYVYLGIAGLFLITSYLILRRKNIT